MKLIWHIVRKDARRLWLPLTLWAVLMTAQHGIEWRALHVVTEDKTWEGRLKLYAVLLELLGVLTGYVLTAALVMEDPPTGTTVFWLTRPMSGARVLGAKLLGCGVLVLVPPVLLALPWWGMAGDTGTEIFRLTRELLRWQVWAAGSAVAVAAFTRGGGQFLGGTLAVQAAIMGIAWGEGWIARATTAGAAGQWQFAKILAVAGVAIAVLIQYHTRRRRAAWAVIGASLAGALLIAWQALA